MAGCYHTSLIQWTRANSAFRGGVSVPFSSNTFGKGCVAKILEIYANGKVLPYLSLKKSIYFFQSLHCFQQ